MAFMSPHYTNEPFIQVTNLLDGGGTRFLPADCEPACVAAGDEVLERYDGKWFCRLSADGYMDQTEWDGPFDTEDAAREELSSVYGVDPDTGDGLECEA